MSDIRSFFGGGSTKKPETTQTATKNSAQPRVVPSDEEFVLENSDDEKQIEPGRKRLKTERSSAIVNNFSHITNKSPAQMTKTKSSPSSGEKSSPTKKSKRLSSPDDAIKKVKTKQNNTPQKPKPDSRLCLDGLKLVVTGVMESMPREDLEQLILERGGKLVGSVSGKTDFLIAGTTLEDGRPACESNKYRNALDKKVKIISEQEFLGMVPPVVESDATVKDASVTNKPSTSMKSSSSNSAAISSNMSFNRDTMLWVDKYKPQNASQLIGSAELVKKLGDWLRRWDAVHLHKKTKVPFSRENPGAKAALLSGPPGIGKSTVAGLAAKELGYDVIELNASDARSKNAIDGILSSAVGSSAISLTGDITSNKHRLIIMDEVDGMGGSDRGGIAELIRVIKFSKVPIICICNDRQSMKIRSLVNHCYDLRVKRPTKTQISQRLVAIGRQEGLDIDPNAAEILVEQAGNDIRQALNALQMWSYQSSVIHYTELKEGLQRIEKDKVLRLSPFDACGQILSGNRTSFQDRYESFFIDYSLTPLLIQQNYIDSSKAGIFRNPALDETQRLDQLADAAEAVSDSDLAGAAIRGQNQHWELLTTQAVFCLRAGSFVQGFQGFPNFPAWLGKYSTTNKMQRLTNEIVHHTSLTIGQGFLPIRLDYCPYLRTRLLSMLNTNPSSESINELVQMLDVYGLKREDFMENLKELQFIRAGDKILKDNFEDIESKVKTALTKAYNSVSHRSQVLVSELGTAKRKRGGKSDTGGEAILGVDEDEGGEESESEEKDKDDLSAFIAKPKSKKSNASGSRKSGKTAAANKNSKR